jgi:nitrous oxidase accessory protein NosD
VSPLEFGAKADGISDDTAACNAAVAKAQQIKGTLVFPPGVFAISGFIYVRNGVTGVLGQGGVIKCINTKEQAGLLLAGKASGQPSNVTGCRVEGLRIDCNRVRSATVLAIYAQNVSGCEIVGNRIENLVDGYGILLRAFEHGGDDAQGNQIRDNTILGDTSDQPKCKGIGVDATLEYESRGRDAPSVWRKSFEPAAAKHPARSHVIEGNEVTGGYYGIALSAAHDFVIRRNRLRMNMRNISMQNGCSGNLVEDNDCMESLSSGIHLAYGSRRNRILGNRIRTSRARGEGLLQAYVGSSDNLFRGNRVEVLAPAAPKYMIYTGVHADGNQFIDNILSGPCARACIAVESGFNPRSREASHYNFGQGGEGHFAGRGTTGVVIQGNQVTAASAAPVIVLAQVSDDRGSYPLTGCVVTDNVVRMAPGAPGSVVLLKLIEDTIGALSGITLVRNRFPDGVEKAQFQLPRGPKHFETLADNVGLRI